MSYHLKNSGFFFFWKEKKFFTWTTQLFIIGVIRHNNNKKISLSSQNSKQNCHNFFSSSQGSFFGKKIIGKLKYLSSEMLLLIHFSWNGETQNKTLPSVFSEKNIGKIQETVVVVTFDENFSWNGVYFALIFIFTLNFPLGFSVNLEIYLNRWLQKVRTLKKCSQTCW